MDSVAVIFGIPARQVDLGGMFAHSDGTPAGVAGQGLAGDWVHAPCHLALPSIIIAQQLVSVVVH